MQITSRVKSGTSGRLQGRAVEYIVEEIRKGAISPGDCVPTMQEISNRLDVSTKVAFLAIKNLHENGWLEKSSGRRYMVSNAVTHLLANKNLNLCFSSCGVTHIRHGLYQAVYNALARMCRGVEAHLDCVLEMEAGAGNFGKDGFDAIIVADWMPENVSSITHGPVIGLDNWEGLKADYVVETDHFHGGEIMAKHFREKRYRKVVYWDLVESKADMFKGIPYRRLGFLKGWVDAGGHLSDVTVLAVLDEDVDVRGMVQEHAKGANAFFVCCDWWAVKIWEIMEQLKINVPGDIALAGYDGSYEALKHTPPLTTVVQPCKEIARRVLEIVVDKTVYGKEIIGNEFKIEPELFIGGST